MQKKHSTKNLRLLTFWALIIGLIGLSIGFFILAYNSYSFRPSAEVSSPTIYLAPSSGNVNSGENISVAIKVDSNGVLIAGIDVYKLHFDPNFLEVVDADGNPDNGVNIQASSLLGQIMSNSVDNAAGTVMIQDMIPVTAESLLAVSGTLGTINFKAKTNSGTTQTYFDFEPGSPSDCNIWAKDLATGAVSEILAAAPGGSYTITTPSNPVTVNIKANDSDGPIEIDYNTNATLKWSSTGADSCVASGGWSDGKDLNNDTGVSTGNLTASTTFTLKCSNSLEDKSDSVTVNVKDKPIDVPAPTVNLKANDTHQSITITSGSSATLKWSTANAVSCTAKDGWSGSKETSGTQSTGSLTSSKTYTLVCLNSEGVSGSDKVSVNVKNQPLAPTVDLKANNSDGPITVNYSSSVGLSWTSQNATSCTASGAWSGDKSTSGSESTGELAETKTYTNL